MGKKCSHLSRLRHQSVAQNSHHPKKTDVSRLNIWKFLWNLMIVTQNRTQVSFILFDDSQVWLLSADPRIKVVAFNPRNYSWMFWRNVGLVVKAMKDLIWGQVVCLTIHKNQWLKLIFTYICLTSKLTSWEFLILKYWCSWKCSLFGKLMFASFNQVL